MNMTPIFLSPTKYLANINGQVHGQESNIWNEQPFLNKQKTKDEYKILLHFVGFILSMAFVQTTIRDIKLILET